MEVHVVVLCPKSIHFLYSYHNLHIIVLFVCLFTSRQIYRYRRQVSGDIRRSESENISWTKVLEVGAFGHNNNTAIIIIS